MTTGFARVTESLLARLCDRYEFHHLAVNYNGDPHGLSWNLYPAITGGDICGVGRVAELYVAVKPEFVFIVSDPWVVADHLKAIYKVDPDARVIAYCPVDGAPLNPKWFAQAGKLERLVAYTEYGRGEIEKALPSGQEPVLEVVPHGVDVSQFYSLESGGYAAKVRLGLIKDGDPEPFIVLNANQNQPRKRIDLTIRGFAQFAQEVTGDVRLYLHMGGQSEIGWDIIRLSERFGVEDRLVLSGPPKKRHPELSVDMLNLIYNACDVGINTAGGEGWGLVSFEHAAVGRAQIVPRHTSCAEIWDGAAELLEVREVVTQPRTNHDFSFTSAHDVAKAIDTLYRDPARREEVARRCCAVSRNEEYSWDVIAVRWAQLFQEACCQTT